MASTAGTSTSAVVSSLVANLVLCTVFVSFFLVLRLRFKRIYSPKCCLDLVPLDKRPEPLPNDPFRWIFILLTKPHSFIIQQAGLDGYFFLRYILIMAITFGVGVLIWTVLLPVNATDGNHHTGLDQLSISNVQYPRRFYAHAFMSWLFYGSLMFIIYRELFFFNSVRLAALSLPKYASKLSSRTVLFQNVPDAMLDEKQFFKLFNGVKRIYVARNTRHLERLIFKRREIVTRLELAINKLLTKAYKTKLKADKKGIPIEPRDDINAYVPYGKRPKWRQGGFFHKKVDTIEWCLKELPGVNAQIHNLQKRYRGGHPKNSLFVEFESQYSAQIAFQSTVHHTPFRMSEKKIGLNPDDVVWTNLRMFWWESITRRALAIGAVVTVILLWAVPVAFVGAISNINYLIQKFPWLNFVNHLPRQLRGIITGLLPTVLLSLLMYMLPIFFRSMAQVSGEPSKQGIELYTQIVYFAFSFLNGFLVTTLSSSAASTVSQIVNNPEEAMRILASGLPKSSNFYISYLILQGFTITGGSLFQVVGLFLYYILGRLLDNTVRKKWDRFSTLGSMAWGTTFPIFTNLACITLAYSIISPVILLFASVAFFLVYITYCYNLTYVFIESADTRGAHYPRALFQTFTGIYVGQVCLLGLFVVGNGWGPIVLQAAGLCFTAFCHINLNMAFDNLLKVVPIDCMKPLDGVSETPSFHGESEYRKKVLNKKRHRHHVDTEMHEKKKLIQDMAHEQDIEEDNVVPLLADRDYKTLMFDNPLVRFLRPDISMNYREAKKLLPVTFNCPDESEDNKHAYDQPSISDKCPGVWIPRDPMGLSAKQIEILSDVVEVSDENSGFDEKGRVAFFGRAPN